MEWVLLRGWVREKRHWNGFDQLMAEKLSGSKIICLDLPGIGENSNLTCPISVSQITDLLRAQLPTKTSRRKILGISLGGMISIDWATRYPEDFDAAVIINSSASNLNSIQERINFSIFLQGIKILLRHCPEKREEEILKLSSNKFQKPPYSAGSLPFKTSVRQLIAATRFKALSPLKIPSLFLLSEKDRLVNPVCGQALARVIDSVLVTHSSAGHDLSLDEPEWIVEQIQKWETNAI